MEKIVDFCGEPGSGNTCLHPLLIPTVLNKVFGSLTFWHQKKCRLVCHIWELELCSLVRKKSKINLTKLIHEKIDLSIELRNIDKICTSFIINGESPCLPDILRQVSFPVKYLELRNFPWTLPYLQELALLHELPQLEELRLPIQGALPVGSSSDPLGIFQIVDTTKKCSFPKMKTIIVTLTVQDLQTYHNKNSTINSLLQIIQASPNLEEIFYPNILQFTSPLDNPARILFENLMTNEELSLRNLSTLKIDTFLCDNDFDLLVFKRFPLRSLQITLTPDVTTKKLYSYLYSIEDTLDTLALTFRDGFRLHSKFPPLKNLRWLSVIVWNGYLDFIHKAVQLKTLVVVLMEFEEEMMLQMDDCNLYEKYNNIKKNTQLEQLEIHAASHGAPETIYKLLHIDTMITKLTMDTMTDKYLRIIILELPALEEFAILYGGFTEMGITGIPMEYVNRDLLDKEFYVAGLKKYPGISDLKNLRLLVLSGEISDFSIIFGVSKCKNLKSLELVGHFNSMVTDRSLIKIANCMDLHYFRTKNLNHITDAGIKYAEEKMEGREIYLNI